ncbi:hypothetical protein [Paenibacillus bouchesdurhonensis]|uniref:hypothetical protein n=1 Tax=Paenibacillus bouchesdurhonensis TaxID=1870990 RepID=UPI000DA5FA0C|nr:hypothetical protein [Paenibacillus bouchesdurhonensis]
MDYGAFFADVQTWIGQANQAAAQYGMQSEQFWTWVADSSSAICDKYQGNRLAIKQMMMLVEWLEEVYERQNSRE